MSKRLATINKVLNLKEQKEEEIGIEVRNMLDQVQIKQQRLSSLEEAYTETQDTFISKQIDGTLALQEMGIYQSYLFHLQVEMDNQKAEIARALVALDARRDALLEAHKETRLVEALRERKQKENAREDMKQERKEMDSLSLSLRKDH
jgi:flagellar FliJ protein